MLRTPAKGLRSKTLALSTKSTPLEEDVPQAGEVKLYSFNSPALYTGSANTQRQATRNVYNTLPHVAFKDPHMPWERKIEIGTEKPGDFAGLPWTPNLAISLTVAELNTADGVANPLGSLEGIDPADRLNAILVPRDLFKGIFCDYAEDAKGTVSASSWATASHRTKITQPTAVVSHLVSLEGLSSTAIAVTAQHVALVLLYSWTWMALPGGQGIAWAMRELAHNILLLRPIQLVKQPPMEPLDLAEKWLRQRAEDGYVLCRHVLPTGEETTGLLRGFLSPTGPQLLRTKSRFSLFGTDLQAMDQFTGFMNVSLNSAWELGGSIARADRVVSANFLRLRGHIHLEAIKAAQAAMLTNVHVTRHKLAANFSAILQTASTRGDEMRNRYKAALADSAKKAAASTDGPSIFTDGASAAYPAWQHVLTWIVDKLNLVGIPSHYLISDQNVLPSEAFRTFYVDQDAVEALTDGALSLGNHSEADDDGIRREIRAKVNAYLGNLMSPAPGSTERCYPRVPTWGFVIRNHLVQAYPDPRVEIPFVEGTDMGRTQVLSMEQPASDILVYLLDRRPNEGQVLSVTVSQPAQQPS
ncbi:hypothetical protein N657DRAFT_683180 [Parathielavia appendiculata]|uniref:Uncharacterized protein n=1 Tax=Parathielavia appendiculata TaxID=2587402 RepID=A0AAN6TUT4_9PEZI|nr:hypothetical protein N657DRAFT_683180 [Parathielavia appendiculata]